MSLRFGSARERQHCVAICSHLLTRSLWPDAAIQLRAAARPANRWDVLPLIKMWLQAPVVVTISILVIDLMLPHGRSRTTHLRTTVVSLAFPTLPLNTFIDNC
jgi:hypothetical protein